MRTITIAEVRTALTALRDRTDPNFRYTDGSHGCYYNASAELQQLVRAGAQRCIIGQLLFDLGIDLPQSILDLEGNLQTAETEGAFSSLRDWLQDHDIATFESVAPSSYSSPLTNTLMQAQTMQDDGSTWHKAIDAALELLPV